MNDRAKAPAPPGVGMRTLEYDPARYRPRPSGPRIDVTGIAGAIEAANTITQLAAENDALRAELATRPTVAPEAEPLLVELIAALGWQGGNREQALNAVRELRAASVRS